MKAQKVYENIRFERGGSKPSDIGVGKYRDLQGMPEEMQKLITLLREKGYWREDYNKGLHLRTEDGGLMQYQFFWDYTKQEKQYHYQGAKMLWSSLIWIDWRAPEEFFEKHSDLEGLMYEIGGWPSFEGSVQIQKIDPDSDTSKYYGGPITVQVSIRAEDPNSSEPLFELPSSYEKHGLNTPEEVVDFISKRLKMAETYLKRFLNRKYKHLF